MQEKWAPPNRDRGSCASPHARRKSERCPGTPGSAETLLRESRSLRVHDDAEDVPLDTGRRSVLIDPAGMLDLDVPWLPFGRLRSRLLGEFLWRRPSGRQDQKTPTIGPHCAISSMGEDGSRLAALPELPSANPARATPSFSAAIFPLTLATLISYVVVSCPPQNFPPCPSAKLAKWLISKQLEWLAACMFSPGDCNSPSRRCRFQCAIERTIR